MGKHFKKVEQKRVADLRKRYNKANAEAQREKGFVEIDEEKEDEKAPKHKGLFAMASEKLQFEEK